MKLENALLKKEEVEIFGNTCFYVPIHPQLLGDSVNIDRRLAKKVFPQAAREWYEDLKKSFVSMDAEQRKSIKPFLKKPRIKVLYPGSEYESHMIAERYWNDDNITTMKNGFARTLILCLSSSSPSLYLSHENELTYISTRYVKFTPEKFYEYACRKSIDADNSCYAHVYLQHNIDSYAQALFLRNWAILYLNKALKQISKSEKQLKH